MGQSPPYAINVKTHFFKASPLTIAPELSGLADGLLNPPFPKTPLRETLGMSFIYFISTLITLTLTSITLNN